MTPAPVCLALVAAIAFSLPAGAAAAFDGTLAIFADADGGTSVDVDASVSPAGWLTLSAGVGASNLATDGPDVGGESLRAAVDLHSAHLGLRPFFRRWADDDDFRTQTIGARAYFTTGGFSAGLILEQQDLTVGFTALVLGQPVARSIDFEGSGAGATISWYGTRWGGYVEGVKHDFDERFDAVVAASRAATSARFPRLRALLGSVLTQTQGALEHELSAGIERMFERSSLRLDWVGVEDAIDGLQSNSLSGSYRHSVTVVLDLEATLGITSGDSLDTVAFAGLAFALHR